MTSSATGSSPMDITKSDVFAQSYSDLNPNPFDEFLTFGNESDVEYTILSPSIYLDLTTSVNSSKGTTLSWPDQEFDSHSSDDRSDKPPRLSSFSNHVYNDILGRAAASDTELLSLEGIKLEAPTDCTSAPRSLPSTPSPTATTSLKMKAKVVEALSETFKKASQHIGKALKSPIRKQFPPEATNDSEQFQYGSDFWGEQNSDHNSSDFVFGMDINTRKHTPPATCRISDISPDLPRTPPRQIPNCANRFTPPISGDSRSYSTPHGTPRLEYSRSTSNVSSSMPPMTPRHRMTCTSWAHLPSSSPANNVHSYAICPDLEENIHWNAASNANMAHSSPNVYHMNAQRATKSLAMHLHNGLAFNQNTMPFNDASLASGLMISIPQHPMDTESPPSMHYSSFYGPSTPHSQRRNTRQPYSHEHMHRLHEERSLHHHHRTARRERQQVQRQQSASDTDSASSKCVAPQVRKNRPKRSGNPSRPCTPPMEGAVEFLNFTPNDSKRILTGVAPSGSSKTKARREKEALDKRRRLGQAAIRAVRAAGGDVECLVEEGLFY